MRIKLTSLLALLLVSSQLTVLGAAFTPARANDSEASASQNEASEKKRSESYERRMSFANNFASIVLAVISDNKKTFEQRKDNLQQAFSKSVDIEWIAKFVIGRAWNNADDAKRERYTELYRKFLTKTYVENFAENPETRISSIKILNIKESNETDFSVATVMKLTNQETMNVSYLVREKEGKYKVLDISIENVSLITTHRAEFGKLAIAQGVEGVIAKLDKLLQESPVALSMN